VVSADGSTITVVGRNRGYTGIHFGGAWTFGADGKPRWADYPKIQALDPNSPGAKAGLAVGDAIVAVNGADSREGKILAAKEPGQTFVVRVRRGEDLHEYTVVSTAKPGTEKPSDTHVTVPSP
jgi:S1-C subfamily serine protease